MLKFLSTTRNTPALHSLFCVCALFNYCVDPPAKVDATGCMPLPQYDLTSRLPSLILQIRESSSDRHFLQEYSFHCLLLDFAGKDVMPLLFLLLHTLTMSG